jgi:hypothetical protein
MATNRFSRKASAIPVRGPTINAAKTGNVAWNSSIQIIGRLQFPLVSDDASRTAGQVWYQIGESQWILARISNVQTDGTLGTPPEFRYISDGINGYIQFVVE